MAKRKMESRILFVALNRGRLPKILNIAARYSLVIFGTMEGGIIAGLDARVAESVSSVCSVYFYETG
jgi:hypothetical protein